MKFSHGFFTNQMCGIAGIVGLETERLIGSMLKSVEHRGRDDQGVWVSEPIDGSGRRACLGHRRLAIIDTSPGGHEPMLSHDGRYVLTFNGEIYNYRELREQLRSHGHEFRTDSDAEVLLAAISEWSWEAVDRLNGMFAFAVWDNKERTLTLVRDHVGIKPLYYSFTGDTFVFGSEIKAILATRLVKPELNPEALHQFLTFLWSPDPNTLFANIKQFRRSICVTFTTTNSHSNSGGTFPSTRSKKARTKHGGASACSTHSTAS